MVKAYDVIVLGSGGGLKIALPAAERGLTVALVEMGAMGGTCLNRGCIPSKMLLYPADLLHAIRRAGRVDVTVDGAARVCFADLVQRVSQTVDAMSHQLTARVEDREGIDLYRGAARFTADRTVAVGEATLTAERVFIATGARPAVPPIDGLAQTPYMTSREALRNTCLPERLIVLGAGYIACELGHAYGAFGADTHFVVRSEALRTMDRDIRAEFHAAFGRHHTLHQGCQPRRVEWNDGRFTMTLTHCVTGRRTELSADALLVATGTTPCTDALGLENTGVRLTAGGYVAVDDRLQTHVPGVYALGDCIGRHFFRHAVNFEGEYLVRTVFDASGEGALDYGVMPYAVFTVPEVAGVGRTEDELLAAGLDYVVGRATYADSNVGLARRLDHGLAKLLFARGSGRLLGAHIVGEQAATLIHTLIAAMHLRATLDDLLDMIYIHPALPEIVRDAARDARARF